MDEHLYDRDAGGIYAVRLRGGGTAVNNPSGPESAKDGSAAKEASGDKSGAKYSFAGDIVGQGAQALDDIVSEEEYLFNAMGCDFKNL